MSALQTQCRVNNLGKNSPTGLGNSNIWSFQNWFWLWHTYGSHAFMKLHEFHQSPWFLHVREPATLGHWLWMYISKQAQMSLFLSNSKIPLYAHPLCSGYSTVLLCHPSSGNRLPELQQADTQCSGASRSKHTDYSEIYQPRSVRAAETYPVESSRKYKDFRYTKIGSGQTKLVDHLSLLCIFTPPFF